MSLPLAQPPHAPVLGIALRIAGLMAIVLIATWVSHLVRDALLQLMPGNEQMINQVIILGTAAYVFLLALPFVPGAEIGIALLVSFGASIAPLVYVATVVAMMLSYSVGRLLPVTLLVRLLSFLHLRQAATLVGRAAVLPPEARVALLLEAAPPHLVALALRRRYVALALSVNIPGNAIIGGGGGIMMMAGLSGLFAPLPTLIAILIGVSPVPLVIMLLGA